MRGLASSIANMLVVVKYMKMLHYYCDITSPGITVPKLGHAFRKSMRRVFQGVRDELAKNKDLVCNPCLRRAPLNTHTLFKDRSTGNKFLFGVPETVRVSPPFRHSNYLARLLFGVVSLKKDFGRRRGKGLNTICPRGVYNLAC